jgi:hypothetical protein
MLLKVMLVLAIFGRLTLDFRDALRHKARNTRKNEGPTTQEFLVI